jgi:hypothetical protein
MSAKHIPTETISPEHERKVNDRWTFIEPKRKKIHPPKPLLESSDLFSRFRYWSLLRDNFPISFIHPKYEHPSMNDHKTALRMLLGIKSQILNNFHKK